MPVFLKKKKQKPRQTEQKVVGKSTGQDLEPLKVGIMLFTQRTATFFCLFQDNKWFPEHLRFQLLFMTPSERRMKIDRPKLKAIMHPRTGYGL